MVILEGWQARVVLALIGQRDTFLAELQASLDGLCGTWNTEGLDNPVFHQRQDGSIIIVSQPQGQQSPATEQKPQIDKPKK